MKINVSQIEQSQTKYTVTIDGKEWQECLKKGLEKITKNIQVPGFRKGKVPMDVVKGKVSDEDIIQESAKFASDKAFKYVMDKEKPQLLMHPILFVDSVDNKKAVLSFDVQNLPEIKLKKYKDLGIKKEPVKVTKADIQKDIDVIMDRSAKIAVKKDPAALGDIVVMDFEGFIDKKAFPGGVAKDHSLELGSNTFIPGFEDQLVGVKKGDSKDVDVSFPKNYHAKEFAGKKAIFKCTIKEVKSKKNQKLTDAFVKEQKIFKAKTVKEFEAKMEEAIKVQKQAMVTRKFEDAIIDKLIKEAKFEVPPRFLELETNTLIKEFEDNLKKQGMDMPKFKEMSGKDDQQIAADFATQAEKRCKVSLIFEHIAKQEKIDVSKSEVEAEYKKMAKARGNDIKELEKQFPAGRLAYNIKMQKIFNIISK